MTSTNKVCPERTHVYISGPDLKEVWLLMKEREFPSLSWTVRILVREGLRALGELSVEATAVEEEGVDV